jgi:O-antigen/teichoic acid export membrane protein
MVLTVVSVLIGTGLSVFIFMMKNKNHEFGKNELLWLATNFGFSLLIVLGIGFYFLKKRKDGDLN